jgi:hypothetical protein
MLDALVSGLLLLALSRFFLSFLPVSAAFVFCVSALSLTL